MNSIHQTPFVLSIICILLISCTKEHIPLPGIYKATFDGSYTKNDTVYKLVREQPIFIISATENQINFSHSFTGYEQGTVSSSLTKYDKNKVNGVLFLPYDHGGGSYMSNDIEVEGKIEKISKNNYVITGTHTYIYTEIIPENQLILKHNVMGEYKIVKN